MRIKKPTGGFRRGPKEKVSTANGRLLAKLLVLTAQAVWSCKNATGVISMHGQNLRPSCFQTESPNRISNINNIIIIYIDAAFSCFQTVFFSKLIWRKQNSMLRMNHTSSMPVLRPEPNGCGDKTCKYEWRKALIVFGFLPLDVLMCQNKSQKPLCRSLVSLDTLSALWWSQPALPFQWSAVSPPATSFQSGRATAWGMEHLSGSWNGTTLASSADERNQNANLGAVIRCLFSW